MRFVALACLGAALLNCAESEPQPAFADAEALGEALFFEVALSINGTQSCATCHNPDQGFIDSRMGPDGLRAVSVGADGRSLGDRNAPTVSYAALSRSFGVGRRERLNSQRSAYEGPLGGQFHDGRALDLSAQAMGPVLNPVEMAMPSEEAVVQRLRADERYRTSFEALFGNTIFEEPARAYRAMAEAIAAFEASDTVSPFDSRYDRSLEDSVQNPLSLKEALGKSLFFSQTDTNCATCHQLRRNSSATETFTSGEYHNIGVPPNIAVRTANGLGPDHIDHGLMAVTDNVADDGKFKVPTLRNIAVTGPYMHNGVFAELRTVVLFYDQRFEASSHPINPETGEPWADPEVATTINHDELGDGGPLTDTQIEALVCFMRTLTDARFESLIPEDGITCTDP